MVFPEEWQVLFMRYIQGSCYESDFNLAMEQYVFDALPRSDSWFMLWQNAPSVIIGKYQNAYAEVNREYLAEHNIPLIRRLSGGGAVYHDLGNINYTFIVDGTLSESENLAIFCRPLVSVLEQFGIHAQISGRNDVTIDGMKISGTARYFKQGRIMHHGTILFRSDLSVMPEILRVSKAKLETKGIRSVKSRVTNIADHMKEQISVQQFLEAFRDYVRRETPTEDYILTEEDQENIRHIRDERYGTWEWNWGKSPAFSQVKEQYVEGVGKLEIHMNAEHGRILDCAVYGDYFGTGFTPETLEKLHGIRMQKEDILAAVKEMQIEQCIRGLDAERFAQLLIC